MKTTLRAAFLLTAVCACLPAWAAGHTVSSGASALVLPVATAEPPIFVDISRSSSTSSSLIVTAASPAPRSDGASISAAVIAADGSALALQSSAPASPRGAEVLAALAVGGTAVPASGGMLGSGQRLSTTVAQAELGQTGQLSLTINYN